MKKALKTDPWRQRRRQRALERFQFDANLAAKDLAYASRKITELNSLQRALGLAPSPLAS